MRERELKGESVRLIIMPPFSGPTITNFNSMDLLLHLIIIIIHFKALSTSLWSKLALSVSNLLKYKDSLLVILPLQSTPDSFHLSLNKYESHPYSITINKIHPLSSPHSPDEVYLLNPIHNVSSSSSSTHPRR